jgi:hypothetical protein
MASLWTRQHKMDLTGSGLLGLFRFVLISGHQSDVVFPSQRRPLAAE